MPLTYEATVPRSLVHVRSLSEVFIADSRQESPTEYSCAVQLPRTHFLWGDRPPRYHDPVVSLEVGRQTVFLVLHHYIGVPVGWKFVLRTINFGLVDLEAFADDHVHPPEGVSRVRINGQKRAHGVLEASFEGGVTFGGRDAMTMHADITVCSPYNFALVRARGRGRRPEGTPPPATRPVPLAAHLVGRSDPRNVVLHHLDGDGSPGHYGLIVNEAHPAFFDHPHDHVTGSLILEVFRQAALATVSGSGVLSERALVTACTMSFSEFAELDAATTASAELRKVTGKGDALVGVRLHQFGETIARADLQLSEPPALPVAPVGAGTP